MSDTPLPEESAVNKLKHRLGRDHIEAQEKWIEENTRAPLPEDIVELLDFAHKYLKGQREAGRHRTNETDTIEIGAEQALAKYAPKPKSLTGVVWTRAWVNPRQLDEDAWTELANPEGVYTSALTNKRPISVWPKIEGINPTELLNDGWQIRQWQDVPRGWSVAVEHGSGVQGHWLSNAGGYVGNNWLIVFCRPPQEPTP